MIVTALKRLSPRTPSENSVEMFVLSVAKYERKKKLYDAGVVEIKSKVPMTGIESCPSIEKYLA